MVKRFAFLTMMLTMMSAQAETLNFDNIKGSSIINISQYAGYQLSGFHANDVSYMSNTTNYVNASTSGSTVLVNSYGGFATMSKVGGGLFDFGSANMTAAWYNGLQVEVQGKLKGAVTFSTVISLDATLPVTQVFNFTGIDTLTFKSYGGVADSRFSAAGGGTNFTMDDMVMSPVAAVPEPSTYAMLFAGLGLVGFMARKRRIQA